MTSLTLKKVVNLAVCQFDMERARFRNARPAIPWESHHDSAGKLTWLALGGDHVDPSRGGEQAIALGRL